MTCFIYKSLKKEYLYLYIKNKDDFSCLPEVLFNSLGKLELVIEITLTSELKLANAETSKVIASLNEKGYFIQMPPTNIAALPTLQ